MVFYWLIDLFILFIFVYIARVVYMHCTCHYFPCVAYTVLLFHFTFPLETMFYICSMEHTSYSHLSDICSPKVQSQLCMHGRGPMLLAPFKNTPMSLGPLNYILPTPQQHSIAFFFCFLFCFASMFPAPLLFYYQGDLGIPIPFRNLFLFGL